MVQATFRFENTLKRRSEHLLLPSQDKSLWFQYADEPTIAVDAMLDEIHEPYQYDERQKLIEAAPKKRLSGRSKRSRAETEFLI